MRRLDDIEVIHSLITPRLNYGEMNHKEIKNRESKRQGDETIAR